MTMIELMLTVPEDAEIGADRLAYFLQRTTGAEFQMVRGDLRHLSGIPDSETIGTIVRSAGLIALAGGPLIAAIKMLPEDVRARRTSVKVTVFEGDRRVEVELDSVGADDAVRVIEQALNSNPPAEPQIPDPGPAAHQE